MTAISILMSGCVLGVGGPGGERVLLVLGAHGDNSQTELGSYMALAEDEEIGRSEKDSSLRQKTARRKYAVTHSS